LCTLSKSGKNVFTFIIVETEDEKLIGKGISQIIHAMDIKEHGSVFGDN